MQLDLKSLSNSLLSDTIHRFVDTRGGQNVPIAVPIPAKDQGVVSGGFKECQNFGEFTIGPIAGSVTLRASLS